MKLSTLALATVSLGALAAPALAQEAASASPTATAADSTTDAADTSGDIIVTATRRAERLQDVPVAVSAITGDQLAEAGFKDLTDIQYQFSGVQFGTSPNDAGFRLRGVGTAGGFNSASEQNVGTVVDNVVIPFGNPVSSLGDLERVEVLKGPQGTQFGKNASSGVVNITTRRPVLGEFSGNAFASYAELNEHDVHGAVNVPLGKTAALNVFGFHRHYDGFLTNVVRNEKWGANTNYGVRAKLLWEPSDDFSAYLIGDWSKTKRFGPGQLWTINRLPSFANPLMAARFGAVLALGITPGFNNNKTAEEYPAFGGQEDYGASLELNYNLGSDYTITSVTAYRALDTKPNIYGIDGTQFPIFTAQESGVDQSFASEELRLTSPKGNTVEYVAGVYLSRRRSGYGSTSSAQLRPALPFSADPQLSISAGLSTTRTQTESAAVFADGSVRITDEFRLLGGARYSYDWVKAASFSVIDPAYPPFVGPNGFTVPYTPRPLDTGKVSKGDWSGRAGAEYKPSDNLLFFVTVARGYLGPTVTFSGLSGTRTSVDPQTVRDITIGAKTQFFDRLLTLNGNVFYDKYKNLQTSVFNGFEFLTENAGGFEAKGFELDAVVRPSRQFSFNASYTYSKTKFTNYITSCPNSVLAAGAAAVAAQCNASGSTAATPLFQARGLPLAGAPKHSVTAGADFNQPIGDKLKLDASVNYYYRSRVFYDVGNTFSTQGGYSTVGGTIGFGAADGTWRTAVFVRNLFDKRFHAAVIGLPFSDPGGQVNWLSREGRRTIGGSLEVRF
ncbi:TonB-dependent receptor [Sphingomonas tabacisoli]|uniref:TonB-dependent receptor n=1 Tax=Sphingomonas tabacisoli TaxID=2249466 RepID=A0ABW4I4H6_9SPHN